MGLSLFVLFCLWVLWRVWVDGRRRREETNPLEIWRRIVEARR